VSRQRQSEGARHLAARKGAEAQIAGSMRRQAAGAAASECPQGAEGIADR